MAPSAGELPDLSLDQLVELERRAEARAASGSGGSDAPRSDDADPTDEDDDDVVLSWWQHPVNVITLVVTAALLAGMIGWMVGDNGSRPQYGEVDVGFLHDMRVHHEQAVYMGFVFRELPDTNPGLDIVAGSIVMGQSQEIGRMVQMLRGFDEPEAADATEPVMGWMGMSTTADQMPGIASGDDIDALLASSGTEADELFAELMIAHHEGGIHMAEFAAENAENDDVRGMARSIVRSQRGEIDEIRGELG